MTIMIPSVTTWQSLGTPVFQLQALWESGLARAFVRAYHGGVVSAIKIRVQEDGVN